MKKNESAEKKRMNPPASEERGIALIITLGILSILIVVALAFVSSARTSRKAASTHASVTKARLIAESALEKITGLIKYYNTHHGEIKVTKLASSYTSGDDVCATTEEQKQDWLYRIFSGAADQQKHSRLTDTTGNPTVEWEYVKIDGKIVGRVGYTIEGNGKLNPARLVDNTTKYPNAMGGPLRDEANDTTQPRIGIEVNEMRLGDLPGITTGAGSVGNISDFNSKAASPAGLLPDDGNWPDIDSLCSKLGVTGAIKTKFKEDWFTTNPHETKEAFWSDDNGDGKIQADGTAAEGGTDNDDEMYCRFNMRRYVDNNNNGVYDPGTDTNLWDNLDGKNVGGGGHNDIGDVEYLLKDPKRIDDPSATPNNTGGIMWLSRWGKKIDGSYVIKKTDAPVREFREIVGYYIGGLTNDEKVERGRYTIAANLIDYCDTDHVPTSDVDPATWNSSHIPAWFGLERTRYFNEALFECSVQPYQVTVGPNKRNQYGVSITLTCETVDIFRGALPDVEVYFTGEITLSYLKANGGKASFTQPFTDKLIDDIRTATSGKDFETTSKDVLPLTTFGNTDPASPTGTPPAIIGVSSQINAIFLKDKTTGVGVYFYHAQPKSTNFKKPATTNTTIYWDCRNKDPGYCSKYVNAGIGAIRADLLPILGNNNQKKGGNVPNDYADCLRDRDDGLTVVVDSANGKYMQAAQIRDDLMRSPWEIGFIHRVTPFQTLNIAKFNESDNGIFNNKHMRTGGNLYAGFPGVANCDKGGDANILSQIKMQPEMARYGLVDINTKGKDVLKLLLSGITVNQADDMDDFSTGTPLTIKQINDLADAIYSNNGAYTYRSQVANAPGLCDNSVLNLTPDTAAKREEIIGKFINLTSTTSNTYRIVILAQAIKDIGGTTLSKDLNYDGKIDATGAVDTYDADGDTSCSSDTIYETKSTKLGTYDQMFDEITAEQKIAVELTYDTTANQWHILKYKYLDD